MLTKTLFSRLPDGRDVHCYRITNSHGEFVEILDYGACLYSIHVLDSQGALGDVILGISSPDQVATGRFAGSTIGRCANRIAQGRFRLNGKQIQLECNQGGHHLHGGSGNYAHQLFTHIPTDDGSLYLTLNDVGAGGYGNEVTTTIGFSFDDQHRLTIHYHMVGKEDTLLCPTNHAYFNLDCSGDICSHRLQIMSQHYAKKGPSGMPEGMISPVADTPLDFRQPRPIGDALAHSDFFSRTPPELDDTFLLGDRQFHLAAELSGSKSGRWMKVYTDMPALTAFTIFIRQPVPGKHSQTYRGYPAIALETQYVPNAVNCPSFVPPIFPAGHPLDSRTVFAFGCTQIQEDA